MAPRLQLNLLGAPVVGINGRCVSFETNKSQALLFYLALNPGWHMRDLLGELLWPDMPNAQSRKNLRDGLVQLRAAVGDRVIANAQRMCFAGELPYESDILQFKDELAHARAGQDVARMQIALDIYRGDFLLGFHVRKAPPFEEWVRQKREELYTEYIEATKWLVEEYFSRGEYSTALAVNRRLLKLEPWNENGHRRQMQLLVLSGRNGEALAQYAVCQELLAAELGMQPTAETVTLYEQIRAGDLSWLTQNGRQEAKAQETEHRAPAAALAEQHNSQFNKPLSSPAPLSQPLPPSARGPLAGRQQELSTLIAHLHKPTCRLLTLSGEGGVGKTRLAQAIAEDIQPQFVDGVWWVALSATVGIIADPLALAIGKCLRISFDDTLPLGDQLCAHLQGRHLLLILDHFSPTANALALLDQLLAQTSQVKIMLTMREPLGCAAEDVFTVRRLQTPPALRATPSTSPQGSQSNDPLKTPNNEEEYASDSSIQCFIAQARWNFSDFHLDACNQSQIIRICQLVDGLPLSIELAVRLLRRLDYTTIITELTYNLVRATSTIKDNPNQQPALTQLLELIWQLLSGRAREVLLRLSVFNSRFSRHAAFQIGMGSPSLLNELETYGLLHRVDGIDYQLPPTVYHFVATYRNRQPELNAEAWRRYCSYQAQQVVETLAAGARHTLQQVNDLSQSKLDNIQAAWCWAVEHQYTAAVERLSPYVEYLQQQYGHGQAGAPISNTAAIPLRYREEADLLRKWLLVPERAHPTITQAPPMAVPTPN